LENSIAKFWGDWSQNILRKRPDNWRDNSWAQHHGGLTRRSLWSTFWLLRIRHSSAILLTHRTSLSVIFFLFPKMKLKLKGRSFDSIKEIQTVLQDVIKTLTRNDFQKCFRSWKSR
jgi:hypothetical protein